MLPYSFFFSFFDRLAETTNVYSRAYGPPSQLLKEDNNASAVKSHDDLQLVLKDLELLEVGLFWGFLKL